MTRTHLVITTTFVIAAALVVVPLAPAQVVIVAAATIITLVALAASGAPIGVRRTLFAAGSVALAVATARIAFVLDVEVARPAIAAVAALIAVGALSLRRAPRLASE